MPEEEQKNEQKDVPYIVHKEMLDMQERHVRRLVYTIVFTIILLVLTNSAWLWFFNQFTISTESSVTVDGREGAANYINGNGDITNGERSGEDSREN